jgi:arsenate reductase
MADRVCDLLPLCTGDTARSIRAESLLRKHRAGRFTAFSAGSRPTGVVDPFAPKVLGKADRPTDGFRSKSREAFGGPGAPVMDSVFTVCDAAAGEACPVRAMTAHRGIADPAAIEGTDSEKEAAFVTALRFLENRIAAFAALQIASIEKYVLGDRPSRIGRLDGASVLGGST